MGLLDTLLGRSKPVRPNLDALFALPSAAVTLETAAGYTPSGHAGVCWKPPGGRPAADIDTEITDLLAVPDDPGAAPAGALTRTEDSFGYQWLLLEDPALDDLVTRVHMVNSTLSDAGWGPQLLCSVFGWHPGTGPVLDALAAGDPSPGATPGAGPDAGAGPDLVYLVYLFKRGTFYPFAPLGGQRRDSELELRLRSVLGSDLPLEPDLSRWFPLWDVPVR